MTSSPYLSLCVFSRNDNHGGDMYRRMKTSLFGFFELAERAKLRSEIVLVDWNPPEGKSRLKDAYAWPKEAQYCSIRIIEVPLYFHKQYENWEKMPVNFPVAQNVAIRRSRGKFILATCVDNLFSEELIRFLAAEQLDPNCLYRIDKCDVDRKAARFNTLDEQLAFCRQSILSVDRFRPEMELANAGGLPGLFTGAPGDFLLVSRGYWQKLRGVPETDILGRVSGTIFAYMAYFEGARFEALQDPMRLFHIEHGARSNSPESNLWARLGLERVLPEWFAKTLKKTIRSFLPARDGLVRQGIPFQSSEEMLELVTAMSQGKRSTVFNDASWGLGNSPLCEFDVTQVRQRSHKPALAGKGAHDA